jgi:predicted permease
MLNGLAGDIRQCCRHLRRSPGYAITAIATLTLAIGANSAIFNVVNAVILANLPVPQPEDLITIFTVDSKGATSGLSIPSMRAIQQRTSAFSGIFAFIGGGMEAFEVNGVPAADPVDEVFGDYYEALGIKPALGRFLGASETGNVAVIGYSAWQHFYQGSPDALGKIMLIAGKPHTIVGVHPKSFTGLIREVEPLATIPVGRELIENRKASYYTVIARLRKGIGVAEVQTQIAAVWPSVRAESAPDGGSDRASFLNRRIRIEPAARGVSYLRQRFTQPLFILTGIVAILLLLACVNLASVALARAHSRTPAYALRVALGASRWRLARLSIVESMILAIGGAIPGFAFAAWSSYGLAAFMWTGYGSVKLAVAPNPRVGLFTLALAVGAAILCSLIPALRTGRTFHGSGSRVTGGSRFTGRALVAIQIALSFSIVCSAALFGRSLIGLVRHDFGFASDKLLVAQLFPRATYRGFDKSAYHRQLLEKLHQIPGVQSAAIAHERPIGFRRKAIVQPSGAAPNLQFVTPGFFETMKIPILRGRDFDLNDGIDRPHVALVSATLARAMGADPIGRHFKVSGEDGEFEIIGIVGNTERDPRVTDNGEFYGAILQAPKYLSYANAIVRTQDDPVRLSESLRRQIESLGHEHPLQIETVDAELNRALSVERVLALLAGSFGAFALLLAAIGLFGLLSYTVSRRTAEIGVRVALGASRGSIAWLTLHEVMILLAIGLTSGLAIAVLGGRAIKALIFGVSAYDPAAIAIGIATLVAVSLASSLIPCLKASRIDAAAALRVQ